MGRVPWPGIFSTEKITDFLKYFKILTFVALQLFFFFFVIPLDNVFITQVTKSFVEFI